MRALRYVAVCSSHYLVLCSAQELIAAIATYAAARGEVDLLLDEELRQIALSLRDHAQIDLQRLQRASDDPELRVLVQIWDPAFDRPYSSRVIDPYPASTQKALLR